MFVISVKFRPIINMCIGPFSEPPQNFLFGKPALKFNLENLMVNDRVLTSQEWYCFTDFVSNLFVENMTKTQHFRGKHERGSLLVPSKRRVDANITNCS